MKRSTQTWSEYLANKNVRPKTFNVALQRNSKGEYEIVGHNAFMKHDMGGKAEWVKVDARDLARSIRNSGLIVK